MPLPTPDRSATIAPLHLLVFRFPDPLQRLAELSTALWSCQVTLPKDAADPPDLKTAKCKGDQALLEIFLFISTVTSLHIRF